LPGSIAACLLVLLALAAGPGSHAGHARIAAQSDSLPAQARAHDGAMPAIETLRPVTEIARNSIDHDDDPAATAHSSPSHPFAQPSCPQPVALPIRRLGFHPVHPPARGPPVA
jgi:hypothetical protein